MHHDKALWQYDGVSLAQGFRDKTFSPVDALKAVWQQIDRHNPVLNALITEDRGSALAAASASEQRWSRGQPLSRLDGVPITIKDNITMANLRATWGSRLYETFIPKKDELPVARLREAGLVLLGKTNVSEFTLQGYTDNPLFGVTRNPWDTDRTPGGSSGGAAAAVASGMGPIALGTDGGGSIRRPCSHTNLAGLRPTTGRVARRDGFPAILHDFEVIGPMARTMQDVIAMMEIIGMHDAQDPLSTPFKEKPFVPRRNVAPCRILYIPTFGSGPVDPQVRQSVDSAAKHLAQLGHTVETCTEFPLADEINGRVWPVVGQTALRWLLEQHKEDAIERIHPSLAAMAQEGKALRAQDYLNALIQVSQLRQALAQILEKHDVLMTPTAAALPWPIGNIYPDSIDGQTVGPRGHAIFTAFVNAAGLPALNLPAEPSPDGLPIGFQLIGSPGDDEMLCSLGLAYETAHPWHDQWPALAG